ncbi:Lipase, GDSL [Corchorus capsularis]|uniref:Lipase, GDSL n=1 Tax=Corchorus capsularis TaxID=210143 RepID=A0A1R3G3B7_COCAP|nr:Lipase, GDSL [Corchorus capsularis]
MALKLILLPLVFLHCLCFLEAKPLLPPPFHINQTDLLNYLHLENFNNITTNLPAIYVFGDSYIDSGNNNFLPTTSKANFLPNGVDFDRSIPTGRATNGRTVVDFIAQVAGLPFPPAMLGMSESERKTTLTGLNYGSASSGILPLPPMALKLFIELFKNTTKSLKEKFKTVECFDNYMSKSLFFIHIGTNDLGISWDIERNRNFTTAETYAYFLTKEFSSKLKAIYQLGARKFLVNNVSPLGCQPFNIITKNHTSSCVEEVNERVAFYNGLLPKLFEELEISLKGSKFVLCDLYKVFQDVYAMPSAYGFSNVNGSCCIDKEGNGTRPCTKNVAPCNDRNSHVFFDPFHPSENMHFLWVRRFLKDDSICSPMTLYKLMQL